MYYSTYKTGYVSPIVFELYDKDEFKNYLKMSAVSRVAQWKRAGPITQRSEDQNLALLVIFELKNFKVFLLATFANFAPNKSRITV